MIPPCETRTLESILTGMNPKLVEIVGRIRGVGIQEESDLVEAMKWPETVKEELFQTKAGDRKSTRLNSSHSGESRMPSSA